MPIVRFFLFIFKFGQSISKSIFALLGFIFLLLTSCQHLDDADYQVDYVEGINYDSLPKTGLPIVIVNTPESAEMWPIVESKPNGDEDMSFDEAVERLKKAYLDKLAWMDSQISDFECVLVGRGGRIEE